MVDPDLELGVGRVEASFLGPNSFLALPAFLPFVVFSFLPKIRGAQVFLDLSHELVLNTALHFSPLDRIVQEKLL